MKVEDCIVEVKRRSAAGCIDLAFVFHREFARPVLSLMLVFAVPTIVASWLVLTVADDQFVWTLVLWSVMSGLYGGALVAGIGPRVFGQHFSVRRSLADLWNRFGVFAGWLVLIRLAQILASFCLLAPAALLVPWTGFLAENLFLEQAPAGAVAKRMSEMASAGAFWLVLGRFFLLAMLFLLIVFGLFSGVNLLASFLLNIPVGFNRVDVSELDGFPKFIALFSDPFTGVIFQACLWLATPLARLAWFFFYLDSRIRSECWDLDVAFQAEAIRLEGAA